MLNSMFAKNRKQNFNLFFQFETEIKSNGVFQRKDLLNPICFEQNKNDVAYLINRILNRKLQKKTKQKYCVNSIKK